MRKLLVLEQELEERSKDRPPSKFMDTCIAKVTREGEKKGRKKPKDPAAICGNIWYHGLTPKGKKRVKKRGMSEDEAVIAEAVVAEMIADEPELDEALSKQRYTRIADILRAYMKAHPAVQHLAGELARFFAEDNPRFDMNRFLQAAGAPMAGKEEPLAASADEEESHDGDSEVLHRREQSAFALKTPWDDDPELGGRSV